MKGKNIALIFLVCLSIIPIAGGKGFLLTFPISLVIYIPTSIFICISIKRYLEKHYYSQYEKNIRVKIIKIASYIAFVLAYFPSLYLSILLGGFVGSMPSSLVLDNIFISNVLTPILIFYITLGFIIIFSMLIPAMLIFFSCQKNSRVA